MEFGTPYFALLGILGAIMWMAGYWYIGRTPQIYVPERYRAGRQLGGRTLLFLVGIVAWALIAYSLAGPRTSLGLGQDPIEVNDIFFVVDISDSMKAEDLKPNRVEAAKSKILEFVKLRPKDRISIILFSEKVFTLLPLSTDLKLIEQIVEEIKPGLLGSGTNMGDAIGLALARAAQSQAKSKIFILLTDGVSNVGNTTPLQAAAQAKEQKVKIYCIGLGSEDATMPVNDGGHKHYVPIPGGSFDLKTLNEIANLTGGRSYAAQDNEALHRVLVEINQLERTKIERLSQKLYQENYWRYLFWGVLLLVLVEIFRRTFSREVA